MKKHHLILIFIIGIVCSSCNKNKPGPAPVVEKGTLTVTMENKAGSEDLVLNTGNYINANGDTFNVIRFKYYLSNFILVDDKGSEVAIPESYFLIDQSDPSTFTFVLENIPEGNYNKIKFLRGVDSARNVSGIQSGALDPIHGMFWTWSTGYIMGKLEGYSPQSGSSSDIISFHLGGFKGVYSSVVPQSFDMPEPIIIKKDATPKVIFKEDILKWFSGVHTINFALTYVLADEGKSSLPIIENYSQSISFQSIIQ